MRFWRIPLIAILIVFLLPALGGVGLAQSPDSQYFSQTRLTVSGPFLAYFRSLKEPLRQIGYPITRQYTDPMTNHEVQYFQKARLDLVDGSVQLANLGELLHDSGAPIAPVKQTGSACMSFEASDYQVCYSFRQYYQSFEGDATLGLPISELEIRENRYVQYFQYARLEWHPENPAGEMVVVSDLGRIYFDDVVGDSRLKQDDLPGFIVASQVQPSARAFMAHPLAPVGGKQTVYVMVQDQARQPVRGAGIAIILSYPGREPEIVTAPPTGKNGLSQLTFLVDDVDENVVVPVEVVITYNGQEARASTWFRVWW